MSKEWYKKASVGLIETRITDKYHVRVYKNRIAISKRDSSRLTWEEVQEAKCIILGNVIAIEIYPSPTDVINLRHTRHLWYSQEIQDIVKRVCCHPEFNS